MKTLAASVLLALLPGGVALSTEYKPERSLRMEIEATLKLETTTMEIEIDGEPREGRGAVSSETSRKEVHVDRVLETKDGKPVRIRRSFESVGGRAVATSGDNTNESDLESPLEGVTVEIARADGKLDVTVIEGGKPDDKALEGHLPEVFLDALLPGEDVEADAEWDLDADAIKRALRLDVSAALFPRPETPEEEEGGGRRRMRMRSIDARILSGAEWSGKARIVATDKEVDGLECAVVQIELEASGDLPEPGSGGRERGQSPRQGGQVSSLLGPSLALAESTYDISLEGKLVFAIEARRPVSLDLEGSVKTESRSEFTRNESTVKVHMVREGPVTYAVAVSEETEKEK